MEAASTTYRNIAAICGLEKKAFEHRSLSAIATQAGRMWFVIVHVIWFVVWIELNIHPKGKITFDPFPFALLTIIVSLESIFLSTFILMSRIGAEDRQMSATTSIFKTTFCLRIKTRRCCKCFRLYASTTS